MVGVMPPYKHMPPVVTMFRNTYGGRCIAIPTYSGCVAIKTNAAAMSP